VHHQAIAGVRPNQRSWNAAVVRPRVHTLAGSDFDERHASVDIDFDDVWIGIEVGRRSKHDVTVPATRLQASLRLRRRSQHAKEHRHRRNHGSARTGRI
jgi:hypothetical protein